MPKREELELLLEQKTNLEYLLALDSQLECNQPQNLPGHARHRERKDCRSQIRAQWLTLQKDNSGLSRTKRISLVGDSPTVLMPEMVRL